MFYVAGFKFHRGQELIRQGKLIFGTKLYLVPEPENPHDSNAIAIYCSRIKIGYIPKQYAPLYKGKKYTAWVSRIDMNAPTWERVEIDLKEQKFTLGRVWKAITKRHACPVCRCWRNGRFCENCHFDFENQI